MYIAGGGGKREMGRWGEVKVREDGCTEKRDGGNEPGTEFRAFRRPVEREGGERAVGGHLQRPRRRPRQKERPQRMPPGLISLRPRAAQRRRGLSPRPILAQVTRAGPRNYCILTSLGPIVTFP